MRNLDNDLFYFFIGTTVGLLLTYAFMFIFLKVGIENFTPIPSTTNNDIIVDSNMSFLEAIGGKKIPDSVKENLSLVNVRYYSFDNRIHEGQIIVNKKIGFERNLSYQSYVKDYIR